MMSIAPQWYRGTTDGGGVIVIPAKVPLEMGLKPLTRSVAANPNVSMFV